MNKPTKRLGRGLDSLIPSRIPDPPPTSFHGPPTRTTEVEPTEKAAPARTIAESGSGIRAAMLPPESLTPNPFQPRHKITDEDIGSLIQSIRTSGFIQPIAVRDVAGKYQIIAGERRWQAAKSLAMREVPVLIRDATDEQMLELALVENIQREDLNPIDRALAYREFCDRFQLSPERVGDRLGEDRTTVTNYLRLLELPEAIREWVRVRKISMGHARCLLGIADSGQQQRLADAVVRNELSVRALEEIVRRERSPSPSGASGPPSALPGRFRSPHLKDMEKRFEQAVKTRVSIHEGKRRGTGRLVIEYYSLADFERLAELLGVALE